jgi:hypothetical protein
MGDYGTNFAYGESTYKDEPSGTNILAIEPVILVTFENRAYYLSHRTDDFDRREYRLGEFLKRGQFVDKYIFGL